MLAIIFLILSCTICIIPLTCKNTEVEISRVTGAMREVPPVKSSKLYDHKLRYWKTNYCACAKCCGYVHGDVVIGAAGVPLTPFKSVACNDFPFGTKLLVTHANGEEEIWIVQDRGGMGKGHLDLYVGRDHQLALSIPNEYLTVEVLTED